MQLPAPTAGAVGFDGLELTGAAGRGVRRDPSRMQMIFQDPVSSLNPRRKVRDIVAEPLRDWKTSTDETRARVDEMFEPSGSTPSGRPPPARVLRRPVPADLDRPLARRSIPSC